MDYNEEIKKIIFSHIDSSLYTAFIFGSRATGTERKGSDIDIGIESIQNKPIKADIFYKIEQDLEDSDIPYRIDLVDFNTVSDDFKNYAKNNLIILNDYGNSKKLSSFK